MRFLILLLTLYISSTHAQDKCSLHFLSTFKVLDADSKVLSFKSGKQARIFRVSPEDLLSEDYEKFLDQSIEILSEPNGPFGHLRLRVGRKQYSFKDVRDTSQGNFSPREGADRFGFVYMVNPAEIKKLENEIQNFYTSSKMYNIPPYDAYSPPVKLTKVGGQWKFSSNSPNYANNDIADGDIIFENGQYFLASPTYKMPVKKIGPDEFESESYSCVTSTNFWLNKFGMNIHDAVEYDARDIKDVIMNIENTTSAPDIIFQYFKN